MIKYKIAFCLCKLIDLSANKATTDQLQSMDEVNIIYPARSSLANAWDTGLPKVNEFLQLLP